MARRSRKPFELGLDPAAYNPVGLRAYSDEEVKKEYARLRREANDRLRKLGNSEFSESQAYTENVGKFKTIANIRNRRELDRLTQEAARFVTAKSSSASGQREIRALKIESLHAHGYSWVNTKNYNDFVEFMESMRATGLDKIFYSKKRGPRDRRSAARSADTQRAMFEQWQQLN